MSCLLPERHFARFGARSSINPANAIPKSFTVRTTPETRQIPGIAEFPEDLKPSTVFVRRDQAEFDTSAPWPEFSSEIHSYQCPFLEAGSKTFLRKIPARHPRREPLMKVCDELDDLGGLALGVIAVEPHG